MVSSKGNETAVVKSQCEGKQSCDLRPTTTEYNVSAVALHCIYSYCTALHCTTLHCTAQLLPRSTAPDGSVCGSSTPAPGDVTTQKDLKCRPGAGVKVQCSAL